MAENDGLLKRHSSKNSAFLYAVFGIRLVSNETNNFVVSKSCKPACRLLKKFTNIEGMLEKLKLKSIIMCLRLSL